MQSSQQNQEATPVSPRGRRLPRPGVSLAFPQITSFSGSSGGKASPYRVLPGLGRGSAVFSALLSTEVFI